MKRLALVSIAIALLSTGASAEITDHHQHLFSPEAGARSSPGPAGISASDLIKYLDIAGIQRAVVLSVAYTFANPNKTSDPNEYAHVMAENDWTSAQVAKYADRLIGFCSVNPLRTYALNEIARCAKDGHLRTGLKLHFGNSDVDVENPEHLAQLRRVFKAANQNHMAIAAHIRSTVDRNRPYGARQARIILEQVFPEAPNVTIQIAHLAGAGGYDDPAIDEAVGVFAEAIAHNDPRVRNVIFDVSGVAGPGNWKDKADLIVKRMRQLGISRLVYGSDAAVPGNLPQEALKRWRELPLTEEEFRAIEHNTAPYLRN